ncbi:MAG: hypothetical protein RI953_1482 [Pseudomonadota bacterium]|jgi:hypothetical protein
MTYGEGVVSLILMNILRFGGLVRFIPPMKLLRFFAFLLGSLCLLFALVLAAVQSPFVMGKVLPPVQAKLEKDFNLKTKITGLSIDPLARVALEGVSAEWKDANFGKVELELQSVLVRFSFWELLKRRLQVSEIEVVSPRVTAELNLPASTQKSDPSNPLPLLKNLIVSPPAAVNLNSIVVRGLNLDAIIKQGSLSAKLGLHDFDFSSDLQLENSQLRAGIKVRIGGNAETSRKNFLLEVERLSPALPFLHLEILPDVQLESGVQLSFVEPATPYFELSNLFLNLSGKTLLNARLAKGGMTQVSLRQLKLKQKLTKPIRMELSDIYSLESAPAVEFQKRIGEKVLPLVQNLQLGSELGVDIAGMDARVRLPADGIDAAARISVAAPVSLNLTPSEYRVSIGDAPLRFQLESLALKGAAFSSLLKSINPDLLAGLEFETPLDVRLQPPTLKDLRKPLLGARLHELKLRPRINWGKLKENLLSAGVDLSSTEKGDWALRVDNELFVKDQLLGFIPALKPVNDSLGLLKLKNNIGINLSTQWKDLQAALDTLEAGIRNIGINYKVEIEQIRQPPKKSPSALSFPGGLQIQGQLEIPQPKLLRDVKVSTQVDWAGSPLLKNQLSVVNAPRVLTLSGITEIFALLRLRKITPLADQLGMLGGTGINAKWKIALPHKANTILKATIPPLPQLSADANVDAQIQFVEKPTTPLFEKNILQIAGPLKSTIKARLARNQVTADVSFQIPKAGVPAFASVDSISGILSARSRLDLADGIDLAVKADVGGVEPAKALGLPEEIGPYLKNIATQLNIQTDAKTRVDIRQGSVNTGKDKFIVNFKGGSDIKATNSRFEGQLAVKPPKVFRYGIRAQDKVSLDGVVHVGWELTQKEQKSVRLAGEARLEGFSAQHQLGGLRNANGRIPFQQELELINFKSLKWSYLIQDNPFKRVDASKFVPLLDEDSLLVIEQLNALDKKFGPLRGRFSLKQNMLTIDKLDADIFEGVLAGQGFVDIQPSRLMAGLQGRVTKLNTALLAANPEQAKPAPLSARLAMDVDLSKSLVEGRVDVTEIGKNQLLSMMDVLDPTGADPLLNKARLALAVGYPTYVGLQMLQGFLDLDVGIGGVVSQRFTIPHLPLTPIINAKTQDLVKTMREVPIQ